MSLSTLSGSAAVHLVVGGVAGLVVALLDQEPLRLVAVALQPGAHQGPVTAQLFTPEFELELARGIAFGGIAIRLPLATIPDDDIAGAVLAFGMLPSKLP